MLNPRRCGWFLIRLMVILGSSLLALSSNGFAWSSTFSIAARHDDNANLATQEEISDMALTAGYGFETLQGINRDWQLGYGGNLSTSRWIDHSGLNLTELGAHAGLHRKFGLGPSAPRLELQAGVARQFSKVSEWSGTWLRSEVALQKRFGPQWQASLAVAYHQLFAGRAVFSTINREITARLDHDLSARWSFSTSTGYRQGDQLSWCRNSWPPFVGTSQWRDGIFGDDWFPYQRTGRTLTAGISLSRALGPDTSITFVGERMEARTVEDKRYHRQTCSVQFIHRF